MLLGELIEAIHRERGIAPEQLQAEAVAAVLGAAARVLGDRPRLEAVWSAAAGGVALRQVLTVAETVREPFRELPLARLRALGGELAGVTAGEELELSILWEPVDESQALDLDRQFGGLLALSCWQGSLWSPIEEALAEVVLAYRPARRWPEGTLGGLLQGDGGWAKGARGRGAGITLAIAGATWKERPRTAALSTVRYGFRLRLERGGRALEVPLEHADASNVVEAWAARPAPPARRAALQAALSALAEEIAGDDPFGRLEPGLHLARLLESM